METQCPRPVLPGFREYAATQAYVPSLPCGGTRVRFRPTRAVAEAIDKILVKLSHEDRTNIAAVSGDNLFILHYDLGRFIRNEAGLWKDSISLLLDCQKIKEGSEPGLPTIHPDAASMVICEALWRRLREQ